MHWELISLDIGNSLLDVGCSDIQLHTYSLTLILTYIKNRGLFRKREWKLIHKT
jgi:hypothetical protein